MAPIVKALSKDDSFEARVCVTAQHRQMLDQVLNLFEIEVDYDLDIMKSNQNLYDITSKVLLNLKDILSDFKPDIVLVHGDTTTTFAASLAAFYQKISVGHIEAGLRTYNIYSPYPEEANRQMTSTLTSLHFAPTIRAKENLLKEGVDKRKIFVTGNSVIDALLLTNEKILSNKIEQDRVKNLIKEQGYEIGDRKFILVTGHRRENFGKGFENICLALKEIALRYKEIDIVYPLHLNPNVQSVVREFLSDIENIYLINPLDYEPFVYLMSQSYIILTDSGGIQEEAPSLAKPVLVLRDTTERPEALEAGVVKLVGTNKDLIVKESCELIENKESYEKMARVQNPYGDGKSAARVVKILKEQLG
jgi:UDP-N-acetylglucosamine 2-epimerase (non-hydrolysing)